MANPLNTLTKPVAFGARQAFNLTQNAFKTGGALIGAFTGGGDEEPPPQPQQEQQPQPRPRRSTKPKPLDDVAITRKVETEIFRDASVPKGKIDVNTAHGVVWLRGEVKSPQMINQLEAAAKAIPEVKRVENLLHLPKTPAPSRTDTPPSMRKTQRTRSPQTRRTVTPTRVTAEHQPSTAEPGPKEHAQEHSGRTPAPLGSEDPGTSNGQGDG